MPKGQYKRVLKRKVPERFDQARQDLFFAEYEKTFNVSEAARRANIHYQTVWQRRKNDPAFAKRWAEIECTVVDRLEQSMMQRAIYGWLEPHYIKTKDGIVEKLIRKYDTTLQIFMLKKNRPEKYDDKPDIAFAGVEETATALRAFLDAAEKTVRCDNPDAADDGTD